MYITDISILKILDKNTFTIPLLGFPNEISAQKVKYLPIHIRQKLTLRIVHISVDSIASSGVTRF